MGLLSGLAIVIIIVGLIFLTFILTKRHYVISNTNSTVLHPVEKEKMYRDRPSKVFNKMFTQPDIWMGYADLDTKSFQGKLI